MNRKSICSIISLIFCSLMLCGCSLFENLFFTKSVAEEFSFSGCVWADGVPLEDAKVDCGIASVQTDENGMYKFSGISKVVQVNVSKDGYIFPSELVFVNSVSTDVNFRGYKLFEKTGIVKNNNSVVANVEIRATSENGEYSTMTNEYGEFYLPNLAGNVKVTATHDNFKFFTQSFTIAKEDDVVISGTTNINGRIITDDIASSDDFKLYLDDLVVRINDDMTFSMIGVSPDAKICLSSELFHIEQSEFEICNQIDSLEFNCEKFYDIVGSVKSGDTMLPNSQIKVGNKIINSNDGSFCIDGLYGNQNITAICNGFTFETQQVNFESGEISINGTTDINIFANLDYGADYSSLQVVVSNKNFTFSQAGKCVAKGVSLGDVINIVSDEYYVDNNNYKITCVQNISFNLLKKYNAHVSVVYDQEALSDVQININGQTFLTDNDGFVEINGLYGNNSIELSKEQFKFESDYNVNLVNNEIEVIPYKLYNISGQIKSGDIVLQDAQIIIGNENYNVQSDGTFVISNLYGDREISFVCDGYDTECTTANIDNAIFNISLKYRVTGNITCVDRYIQDVKVFVDGEYSTLTNIDGTFEISGLTGEKNISFDKDNYNFTEKSVSCNSNLDVFATYNIVGNVADSNGVISGLKVIILSLENFEQKEVLTDTEGNYRFDNLNCDYILFYDTNYATPLKPTSYTVFGGGRYNFADNGYSFEGNVTCGGVALSGVKISAGDMNTYTDDDGHYKFDLLTKPTILTLSKTGYSFDNNGLPIDDTFDSKTDVDFDATYKVLGVVKSGDVSIANAKVIVGTHSTYTNNSGEFEISGLTGTNQISVEYETFRFVGKTTISKHEIVDFNGTFDLNMYIHTGDIAISDVCVGYKQNYLTDSNGLVKINNINLNSIISLAKSGYNFENFIVSEYTKNVIDIDTTYNVSGYVTNAGRPIEDAKVVCGEIEIYTNQNGYFEINNLSGENTLHFEKENFAFDDKSVCGACNIDVLSKYSVDGYVKVGNKALSGVTVVAGNLTATTNAIGYFVINDLTTAETLIFTKSGYEFTGNMEVNSPRTLNISATYSISGIVKSGDLILRNVKVTVSNGMETTTDENGFYIVYGIDSVVSCTFEKFDSNNTLEYNSFTKSNISTHLSDCNVELTYDVIILFSGVSDYSNISITIGKNENTYSSNSIVLENLKGTTPISFERTNYKFTPNGYNAEKATTINVAIKVVYSISGYVKTSEGTPISGAKVYAGSESSTTDTNGKYTIKNLENTVQIRAILPSWGVAYEKLGGQVSSSASNGDIVINNNDFAYNYLTFAYDNLRNAKSYQIFGTGSVNPHTSLASAQNISLVYKQDEFGHKVFQNKNYGKKISIMGIEVDPNVSLLSYFDMNSKTVLYQQIRGEKNVSQNSVNYTSSWDNKSPMSFSDYKEKFGVDANNFYPYTIDSNTISSISKVVVNTDGDYEFTVSLKCNSSSSTEASYYYYAKLMKNMCSEQDLIGFSSINLKYVIAKNGLLKSMSINESYKVSSKGVDVDTDANITYRFVINSLTEKISPIDVSSPVSVAGCLSEETPIESNSLQSQIRYEMIPAKRRELL